MKKKAVSLVLSLALLFTMFNVTIYGAVADNTVQPLYTYFASKSASTSLAGSTVEGLGDLSCESGTTSCSVKVYLQCRKTGTTLSWVNCGYATNSGVLECVASTTSTARSGYTYRTKAVFNASGSAGSESSTSYSNTITY